MQISPERLAQSLSGELLPIYLIHGDEELLVLEAGDAIRAAARAQGFDERHAFTVEGRFNWQEPLRALQGGSLFASRSLIELRLNNGKLSAEAGSGLENLIQALHRDSLLLLSAPRLDKTAQGSRWFGEIASRGAVIPVPTIDRNALPRWLSSRLAAQKQSVDSDTLAFLAGRVEGNLLAAHQEVLKLGLLCPPGRLEAEQVRSAVLNVARFDVYQLSESLLTGDIGRYARILDGVRMGGEAATLIVWILAEDVRAIATLQVAQRNGANTASLLRELRLWGERQRWVETACRRFKSKAVEQALDLLAHTDRAAKGVGGGDPWLNLRQLPIVLQGLAPACV